MKGLVFEEYLATLFKQHGYHVRLTSATNDYGADLIITKSGLKTVVQAKRYKSNVGIKAVQEIVGSVNYYKADDAMVVTNSYFTKPAIKLAKENNVQLMNRKGLLNLITKKNK